MGYRLVVKHLPTRRIQHVVAQGKADLQLTLLAPGMDTNRLTSKFTLGAISLYEMKLSGFSLTDKSLSIDSLDELYQYRIGHLSEIADLEKATLPGLKQRMRVNTIEQLVKTLFRHRIDIAISDDAGFYYAANLLNISHNFEPVYSFTPLEIYPTWSNISLNSKDSEIINAFSKALTRLKARGEIAQILNRYSREEYFTAFGHSKERLAQPN